MGDGDVINFSPPSIILLLRYYTSRKQLVFNEASKEASRYPILSRK